MFRKYRFTFIFAFIGLALCLLNATGYDPHNLLFFSLSIPVWLIELFSDIHRVPLNLIYALTILTWLAVGRFVDWWIERGRAQA
jgi:hypothetical protein